MNEKDKALIKKVQELQNKIENEKSDFKRAIYVGRLTFLTAQMNKQLEIIELNEKYDEFEKEQNDKLQEEIKNDIISKPKAENKKNKLKKQLHANEIYDPESENFIFKDRLADLDGDVDKILVILEESKEQENIELAEKIKNTIEENAEIRKQIEEIDKQLQEGSQKIDDIKTEKATKYNETQAMIENTTKSNNPIKRFFRGIKAFFANLGKSKEIKLEVEEELEEEEDKRQELENKKEEIQSNKEEKLNKAFEKVKNIKEKGIKADLANLEKKYNVLFEQLEIQYAKEQQKLLEDFRNQGYQKEDLYYESIKKSLEKVTNKKTEELDQEIEKLNNPENTAQNKFKDKYKHSIENESEIARKFMEKMSEEEQEEQNKEEVQNADEEEQDL